MRARRSLDRLEAALPPSQAVQYWLDEREAFESPDAYISWMTERPLGTTDHDRAVERAATWARTAATGRSRARVAEAERDAVRDVICLMQLVHGIEQVASATLELESLRLQKLAWQLRALSAEWTLGLGGPSTDALGTLAVRWPAWRVAMEEHLVTMYTGEAARVSLERRYFHRRAVLYSSTLEGLESLQHGAERLASCWTDLIAPSVRSTGGDVDGDTGALALEPPKLRDTARQKGEQVAADAEVRARIETWRILDEPNTALRLISEIPTAIA